MQNKLVATLAAIMMTTVPTLGLAAMAGSNTVNSAAIVDGSIATADIANSAVTGAKIASGTITATQLAAGSVTATQLASGSVTDAKITGPISVTKLPVGTSSTSVAAGNHTHSGAVKYAQVVVVAKSGGDSTNPASALASITDASAAKPYLVRVMPGVYDIGSSSVVMKPYVDLEGSGDVSVITTSNYNPDFDTCTTGTVHMANNSAIRNLKLVNTSTVSSNSNAISALIFNNVKAKAEGVSVLVGKNGVLGARNNGICSTGPTANATLNNVNVEIQNGFDGHSNALFLTDDGSATLTNSYLKTNIQDTGWSHTIDCVNSTTYLGTLNVINSTIESAATPGAEHSILWINDCQASITNSILKATGGNSGVGVELGNANANFKMVNTQMIAALDSGSITGISWSSYNGVSAKIAFSQISGGINSMENVSLFQCYDENFLPYPLPMP